MTARKKRAAGNPAVAAPVVEAPAVVVEVEIEEAPRRPARGMTTEQIRRIGNRIAEHEKDLKTSNTSRR